MPAYLIPRKSGIHRAACFTLFRALIQHVNRLPLPKQQQNTICNQLRAVIKRNSQLQSPQEISEALRLGHETLGALRSQTAWRTILTRILDLGGHRLAKQRQLSSKATPEPECRKSALPKASLGRPRTWPFPDASKTLDRPYLTLSGRRQVPKLVNANRVPFLRLKKPQSPYVSRIIRDTIKVREKRLTLSEKLKEQILIAEIEDEWDDMLFKKFGLENDVYERSWSYEFQHALRENRRLQTAAIKKRGDVAARMHSIIEQEKALTAEEKHELRKEKRQRINIRRLARKRETVSVTVEARILNSAEPPPKKTVEGMTVHDKEKFKTKEEIAKIRAENTVSRTNEEIAEIKTARVRRKVEKAKAKAEKVKRKAESVQFWQKKPGQQTNESVHAEIRSGLPTHKEAEPNTPNYPRGITKPNVLHRRDGRSDPGEIAGQLKSDKHGDLKWASSDSSILGGQAHEVPVPNL